MIKAAAARRLQIPTTRLKRRQHLRAVTTHGGDSPPRPTPPVSKMAAKRLSEMASPKEAADHARSQNGRSGHTTSSPLGRSECGYGLTAIGPSRGPSAALLSWQRVGSGGGRAAAALRDGAGWGPAAELYPGPGSRGPPGLPSAPRRGAAERTVCWGATRGRGAACRDPPGAEPPRCRIAGPTWAGGAG